MFVISVLGGVIGVKYAKNARKRDVNSVPTDIQARPHISCTRNDPRGDVKWVGVVKSRE
jgi:hypothetical protein